MRVTLLVDNLPNNGFRSEHGLSFIVETADGAVLFDTGQSDAWLENLQALRLRQSDIRAAAISHGHYDHAGGLAAVARLSPHVALYAHPACFEQKYRKSTDAMRYIGMPAEAALMRSRFTLSRSPLEIAPGIILSGEVALQVTRELEDKFLVAEDGLRQDTFEDEQCMVIKNNGVVGILVGCAHRGVENNILRAMEIAGVKKVDFVAGGMHLHNADEKRLRLLVAFLDEVADGPIICCHCTGAGAFNYLTAHLGSRVSCGQTGLTWEV